VDLEPLISKRKVLKRNGEVKSFVKKMKNIPLKNATEKDNKYFR